MLAVSYAWLLSVAEVAAGNVRYNGTQTHELRPRSAEKVRAPLSGRMVDWEASMGPKWQRRSWDIHRRFVELSRTKGSLTSEDEVVNFLSLAICGEAGELANLIKKRWQGDEVDQDLLRDEIADIRIYLEHLAHHLGMDIDKACEAKLNVVAARLAAKEQAAVGENGR